ncbi:MAG: type II toxin-antitoxin system VapC family toxin [Rhodanobacteraceae bacterium]
MRLLLDTHAFLWAVSEPSKLPPKVRVSIQHPDTEVFVSAASAWEIATKSRLGKLPGAGAVITAFATLLLDLHAVDLPITRAHALRAGSYTHPHADPFDRMLAAQSEIEGLVLVSKDCALRQFDVEVLW